MEAVRAPLRLGREDGSRSSERMNLGSFYSAMRMPAQMPATPPTPLKSSDWSPIPLAPHTMGTNPPNSIPKLAHIATNPRPMGELIGTSRLSR